MCQDVACIVCGRRVDRHFPFIDVLNNSLGIDHKRGPIAEALIFIENPVILYHRSFEIAEERERDADVLREPFISGNAIHADAENLSIGSFEFGDISLICLQLFRSTTGEREHVEREHNVLLTFEVTELDFLSSGAGKREIRRCVADLQCCFWRRRLLRGGNYGHS